MLKKRALALFFVSSLVVALIGTAAAGDEPFDGPANWGGTGGKRGDSSRLFSMVVKCLPSLSNYFLVAFHLSF
ncbi:MAG: hypothetical protein KKF01_05300 [Proteobacteria bacterium]|nr:hypothetical protein [Pseudomonadota bacterium]MBU4121719.1 hypothetical protein [Pseudomonadota bacterium]